MLLHVCIYLLQDKIYKDLYMLVCLKYRATFRCSLFTLSKIANMFLYGKLWGSCCDLPGFGAEFFCLYVYRVWAKSISIEIEEAAILMDVTNSRHLSEFVL